MSKRDGLTRRREDGVSFWALESSHATVSGFIGDAEEEARLLIIQPVLILMIGSKQWGLVSLARRHERTQYCLSRWYWQAFCFVWRRTISCCNENRVSICHRWSMMNIIMYGGRGGIGTAIVLICKICVDQMCTASAQRKSNKAFCCCCSIILTEGTRRTVIFVWNKTEHRAHLPSFFLSHTQ